MKMGWFRALYAFRTTKIHRSKIYWLYRIKIKVQHNEWPNLTLTVKMFNCKYPYKFAVMTLSCNDALAVKTCEDNIVFLYVFLKMGWFRVLYVFRTHKNSQTKDLLIITEVIMKVKNTIYKDWSESKIKSLITCCLKSSEEVLKTN